MRNKRWLAIALGMVLPVMLFTASCSKKAVKSQSTSMPAPQVQKAPDKPAPQVQKAPEKPAEQAKPDGRLEEDRLRAEAAARESAKWVFVNEHVHFALDSSLLSDQARQILVNKAKYLRTNPDIAVTVEGHCDDRGTNVYNVALGERRAESVKTFLVGQGIGTNRLNTVSYGEERPVAVGQNEASWGKNRRAQLVIN